MNFKKLLNAGTTEESKELFESGEIPKGEYSVVEVLEKPVSRLQTMFLKCDLHITHKEAAPQQPSLLKSIYRDCIDQGYLVPCKATDSLQGVCDVSLLFCMNGAVCVASEILIDAIQTIPDFIPYFKTHMLYKYITTFKDEDVNFGMICEMTKGN